MENEMNMSQIFAFAATMIASAATGLSGCAGTPGEVVCYAGSNAGSNLPPEQREAFRTLAVNTGDGSFRELAVEKGLEGTTYFALNSDNTLLYTISRGDIRNGTPSMLMCYRIVGDKVERDWEIGLPCEAPCHISLSPDGTKVAFAAYVSATAGIVDVQTKKIASVVHEGKGPRTDRQDKAHAHCAFFTPAGDRVGVVDLGIDQVRFYDLGMNLDDSMTITVEPGLGPRHAVFSPDGKFMFIVHELGNAVSSYRFDGRKFEFIETKSILPADFTGETKAAAIKLTADGRILMASNRGHDSIAFFAVDAATGKLELKNIAKLAGRFPRDFELVPGEKFMIVGHKMSNEIQMYAFDREKCTLTPVGSPLKAFRPLCFKFGAKLNSVASASRQ